MQQLTSHPPLILTFASLEHLDLQMNALTSTIPTEMGLLTNLEFLGMAFNNLNGTLPSEIALLSNLWEMTVWMNQLTGTIPEEIYLTNYTALNNLVFGYNYFTGTISTLIGQLSTIGYMYFPSLQLEGTIPTEIGLLSNLAKIHFDHNTNLTGSIPMELCALRGTFLTVINADCDVTSSGKAPMECAPGCCTKCCNQETGTCEKV